MVAVGMGDFKWLSVVELNNKYGTYYQLRLTSKLGRKTCVLGTNKIRSYNIALKVDEEITRLKGERKPIEWESLHKLITEAKEANKEIEKGNLRIVEKDSLIALWDKYVEANRTIRDWSESYFLTHIQTVGNLIKACPYQKLEDKNKIANWFLETNNRSRKTGKDRFKFVVTAVEWNAKQGNIPRYWGTDYRDLLSTIKTGKSKNENEDEEELIDIFKVEEIERILEALRTEQHSRFRGRHLQYYPYAYFLWITGCRPNEAVALKWENVDLKRRQIRFCEGEIIASGRVIKKKGTKTEKLRYFPINDTLYKLLTELITPNQSGYVFRRKYGQSISQQAFNRIWSNLLSAMGIRHRRPYQLRHSMISYHANNDFPIQKLAAICGNSEDVIREHYLRLEVERISLPDVIKPED